MYKRMPHQNQIFRLNNIVIPAVHSYLQQQAADWKQNLLFYLILLVLLVLTIKFLQCKISK